MAKNQMSLISVQITYRNWLRTMARSQKSKPESSCLVYFGLEWSSYSWCTTIRERQRNWTFCKSGKAREIRVFANRVMRNRFCKQELVERVKWLSPQPGSCSLLTNPISIGERLQRGGETITDTKKRKGKPKLEKARRYKISDCWTLESYVEECQDSRLQSREGLRKQRHKEERRCKMSNGWTLGSSLEGG